MLVYSLLGFVDYEGQDLLGVFGSLEDLQEFVGGLGDHGYGYVGYVVSELGQRVDVYDSVVYL